MFTDVSDMHAFKDAINCIAHYGITNGTGDGSTYSPNQDVTRAEMAVFIARAAEKAGVDLKSGSGGFSDIGDVWQEAQDAINGLAASGVIADGGEFRPGDDITRAEMASFLVGLMATNAAPNVRIDSSTGAILLGTGATQRAGDDWFADARASVPAANDAEITAIYELGITKGASAAAVQDTTKRPLDTNYEPFGTVNRGEMAAFITRALAHTSVRPEGISAQFDGTTDVVVSARDENFQPVSNVTVDVFRIDTGGIDLAFRGDGSCGDVGKVSEAGQHLCEIDGSDLLTGGGGDANVALGELDKGGTTVWAWTGDNADTVDDDTDPFRLDIPEGAVTKTADRVRISTEYPGNKKVHLGSSVLYTVQLENEDGPVTVGTDADKPRPAQFLVTLSTWALTPDGRNQQGTSEVSMIPLTTDPDGKATFSASGLPDTAPNVKGDKYVVEIQIQPAPNGNAPAAVNRADDGTFASQTANYYVGANATMSTDAAQTGLVPVRVDDSATTVVDEGLVFSTEASNRTRITRPTATGTAATDTETDGPGVSVSVEPVGRYVASAARGASNRAKVTVTDQYGDPIAGARVSLSSAGAPNALAPTAIVIGGGRALAVGRDGSYTFGYTRSNNVSATETLTARWDHDSDGCFAAADCTDPVGTAGIAGAPGTVHWATYATASVAAGAAHQVRQFNTETNTIFAGDGTGGPVTFSETASLFVLSYDSNDRFNLTRTVEGSPVTSSTTYAGFERALSKATGYELHWLAIESGSRSINTFTLIIPTN